MSGPLADGCGAQIENVPVTKQTGRMYAAPYKTGRGAASPNIAF